MSDRSWNRRRKKRETQRDKSVLSLAAEGGIRNEESGVLQPLCYICVCQSVCVRVCVCVCVCVEEEYRPSLTVLCHPWVRQQSLPQLHLKTWVAETCLGHSWPADSNTKLETHQVDLLKHTLERWEDVTAVCWTHRHTTSAESQHTDSVT